MAGGRRLPRLPQRGMCEPRRRVCDENAAQELAGRGCYRVREDQRRFLIRRPGLVGALGPCGWDGEYFALQCHRILLSQHRLKHKHELMW
jgi:hypothetical protein